MSASSSVSEGRSVLFFSEIQPPQVEGKKPKATYTLVQPNGKPLYYPDSTALPARRIARAILRKRPVRLSDPECGNKHVHVPLNRLFIAQTKRNHSYRLFRASDFIFLARYGMSSEDLQERIEEHMKQCTTAPILTWPHAGLPTAEEIENALQSDEIQQIDGLWEAHQIPDVAAPAPEKIQEALYFIGSPEDNEGKCTFALDSTDITRYYDPGSIDPTLQIAIALYRGDSHIDLSDEKNPEVFVPLASLALVRYLQESRFAIYRATDLMPQGQPHSVEALYELINKKLTDTQGSQAIVTQEQSYPTVDLLQKALPIPLTGHPADTTSLESMS